MSEQKNDQPAVTETVVEKPAEPKPQTTRRTAPVVTPPAKAPAGSPSAPVAAQTRNRHDVAFRHDVFMSDPKDALRNVSFMHLKPELVKVPHKHVYHSHNNNGKPLSRTGSAAGHWHNVEHYTCPKTGQIIAKCGPAMHEVTFLTATGRSVTRIEPVSFEEEKMNGDIVRHMDDHSHELHYLGSEELSPLGIQQDLKSQQGAARAFGIVLGQGDVQDKTPAPMNPADGANIS